MPLPIEPTESQGAERISKGDEAVELERAARHARGPDEPAQAGRDADTGASDIAAGTVTEYKVYKRRWFGLLQLALLNIIVSWDVSLMNLCYYCVIRS